MDGASEANGAPSGDSAPAPEPVAPGLRVGVFCEKVLTENDGVVSLIRIVDRYFLDIPEESPNAAAEPPRNLAVATTLFVMYRAVGPWGPAPVRIVMVRPDGAREQVAETDVEFVGDDINGINLVVNLIFGATVPGTYAFDVSWSDQPPSRLLLQVVHRQVGSDAA